MAQQSAIRAITAISSPGLIDIVTSVEGYHSWHRLGSTRPDRHCMNDNTANPTFRVCDSKQPDWLFAGLADTAG
jgi:hypothetical protein